MQNGKEQINEVSEKQVQEEPKHPVLSMTATTVYKQQSLVHSSDNSSGIPPPPLLLLQIPLFFSSTPYHHRRGSYSELELSLGFELPLRTASQVCFPLSGRAEWTGELVKYLQNVYTQFKQQDCVQFLLFLQFCSFGKHKRHFRSNIRKHFCNLHLKWLIHSLATLLGTPC